MIRLENFEGGFRKAQAIRKALLWQYRIGYRLRRIPNYEFGHVTSCLCLLNGAYLSLFLESGLHADDFIAIDKELRHEFPVTCDETRLAISDVMTA